MLYELDLSFKETASLEIEANSEEEAVEKFKEGDFDYNDIIRIKSILNSVSFANSKYINVFCDDKIKFKFVGFNIVENENNITIYGNFFRNQKIINIFKIYALRKGFSGLKVKKINDKVIKIINYGRLNKIYTSIKKIIIKNNLYFKDVNNLLKYLVV